MATIIRHGEKGACDCGATTAEEVRACLGVKNPRTVGKTKTFTANGIKAAGLTAEHFTKSGLQHVAEIFNLPTDGTKDELAARIREVL